MKKRGEPIYIQRWLLFHPYNKAQQSDSYYLKLCNEIFNILKRDVYPDEDLFISDEEKKDLACFITCYFEDVISGPGLWRAFINQVKELYGIWLPFYDLDPNEYYPDEINQEDLYFLEWYFLSMVYEHNTLLSPYIYEWSEISDEIFGVLEREYETAPENNNLKEFFKVKEDEDNFFIIKEKINWIMLSSWLHYFLREELVKLIDDLLVEGEEDSFPEDALEGFMYDTEDSFIFFSHTTLLARQGKEWLAHLMGRDHPLFGSVLEMGEKKSGMYIYNGTEGNNLLFEHIATETELKVTSESMKIPADSRQGRSIFYAGFVKWDGRWWFSGAMSGGDSDPRLIKEEMESGQEKELFGKDPVLQREEKRKLHDSFLRFNNGKPLAFVAGEEASDSFIALLMVYHNSLVKRLLHKGRKSDGMIDPGTFEAGTEPGMIFSDPDKGIKIAYGYNNLVPDADNPWYVEGDDGGGDEDDPMLMLYSSVMSGQWIYYLMKQHNLSGIEFPGLGGRKLLMDNFDFMLRFWKRGGYY